MSQSGSRRTQKSLNRDTIIGCARFQNQRMTKETFRANLVAFLLSLVTIPMYVMSGLITWELHPRRIHVHPHGPRNHLINFH